MRKSLRHERKGELAYYDLLDRSEEKIGVLGFRRAFGTPCKQHGRHRFKECQSVYRCGCGLDRPKNGVKILRSRPEPEPLEGYPEYGHGRSKMNPRSRRSRLQYLLERDGNACYYCEVEFDDEIKPTLDHVRPRSKGGTNHPANLVLACAQCNNDKGSNWEDA